MSYTQHTTFHGRLVIIGFGCIGQGVLPLLLRHIKGLTPDRITIVTAEDKGLAEAQKYGVVLHVRPIVPFHRTVPSVLTRRGTHPAPAGR